MKRTVLVLGVAALMAAMMVASAMPAFAEKGGCGVGEAVSDSNQVTKELGLGGIGKAAHTLGFDNVGNEVIQPLHDQVKEFSPTCNANG